MRCTTPRCRGNPDAPGGAKGLCPRCYQRARRKQAPAAESTRPGNLSAVLPPVNVDPLFAETVRSAAHDAGETLGGWIRRACHERALRQRARERQE